MYHEILYDLWMIKISILGAHVICSHWLLRRIWRDARTPAHLYKARWWYSNAIAWAVKAEGGPMIAHLSIKFSSPNLFCPDEVHLFYKGQGVILADLQGDPVEALRSGQVGGQANSHGRKAQGSLSFGKYPVKLVLGRKKMYCIGYTVKLKVEGLVLNLGICASTSSHFSTHCSVGYEGAGRKLIPNCFGSPPTIQMAKMANWDYSRGKDWSDWDCSREKDWPRPFFSPNFPSVAAALHH